MSMRLMCGVKKGRVFIGSQSSHQAAHHSAVRSQRSPHSWHGQTETDTHTEPGQKVIYTSPSSPSETWTKLVVDVLGKQWMVPVRRTGGRDSHWFYFSARSQDKHIVWPRWKHFLWLNPSSQLSWPLKKKRMNSEGRFHSKQLIQGKLCICRQYGQCKGNNMNSHHREGNFQAWHQVSL